MYGTTNAGTATGSPPSYGGWIPGIAGADFGGGMVETNRETRLQQEPDFRGDYTKFHPRECVVARAGSGDVHGRVRMLGE